MPPSLPIADELAGKARLMLTAVFRLNEDKICTLFKFTFSVADLFNTYPLLRFSSTRWTSNFFFSFIFWWCRDVTLASLNTEKLDKVHMQLMRQLVKDLFHIQLSAQTIDEIIEVVEVLVEWCRRFDQVINKQLPSIHLNNQIQSIEGYQLNWRYEQGRDVDVRALPIASVLLLDCTRFVGLRPGLWLEASPALWWTPVRTRRRRPRKEWFIRMTYVENHSQTLLRKMAMLSISMLRTDVFWNRLTSRPLPASSPIHWLHAFRTSSYLPMIGECIFCLGYIPTCFVASFAAWWMRFEEECRSKFEWRISGRLNE